VKRGVEALIKVLGPVESARFLSLPRECLLNSVQWHWRCQASLDQEVFFDEVFGPQTRSG
jgi:hypothetical protein